LDKPGNKGGIITNILESRFISIHRTEVLFDRTKKKKKKNVRVVPVVKWLNLLAFLFGVCIFFQCMCGFSPVASIKHAR